MSYLAASGEICIYCHTPHNADATVTDAPLWNHELTTQTFTMYSSGTLDGVISGQPTGVSLLCLSCHDGVTALDSFGGVTRTTLMSGTFVLGTDLANDHPISLTYVDGMDAGLYDPTTTASGLGGNIDADLLFGASNDQLECASCHDVHDDSNGTFLRMANTGSALCLTCHNK
ncbi:MAG: cytochrome c3 family protein [Myxococcales bacterium]|nr:cytochrome c3 family protein [Myxococcales bacterium]MDH5306011.1 cytochrome c3 family protein [Myxococcales bacterium]